MDKWLESRVNHRSEQDQRNGTLVERSMSFYGVNDVNEMKQIWRRQRYHFEQELETYFSTRNNLLTIDIEKDDVAMEISSFLNFTIRPETWTQYRKTAGERSPTPSLE